MAIINVGNRFPIVGYLNNNGISVSILNTRFFDILISMSNPTPLGNKRFQLWYFYIKYVQNEQYPLYYL